MMAKVLIMTGDTGEAFEVLYLYYRLREDGHEAHIGAPSKKALKLVVHDFEPGFETYIERPGYRVEADVAFADVNPDDYDALVIPGGRAPEYIRLKPEVKSLVRHFFESGKPVGALCHAPQVLIAAGVASGRTMTAFEAMGPDIEAAGGHYQDVPAIQDGNLTSGRVWSDIAEFSRGFLQHLNSAVPATEQR
jgi:protease I